MIASRSSGRRDPFLIPFALTQFPPRSLSIVSILTGPIIDSSGRRVGFDRMLSGECSQDVDLGKIDED